MKKIISFLLAVCLISILPFDVSATEYYNQPESAKYLKSDIPGGYNPYMIPAVEDEKEAWMWDANDFLDKAGYKKYEYKFDKTKTIDIKNIGSITSTLDYVSSYSVVDPQLDQLDSSFASPILIYEKEGLPSLNGADTNRQLLGRSDLGVSISNVKFPLINTSWNFIEDAELIKKPYDDSNAKQFWANYTGGKELQKTVFDIALENDPEEAYKIDVLTSLAFIGQVRINNGVAYHISKIWQDPNNYSKNEFKTEYFKNSTKPSKVGSSKIVDMNDLVKDWHNYMNVLIMPTYHTYGIGIGFIKNPSGSIGYKTFPIYPQKFILGPDFAPVPKDAEKYEAYYGEYGIDIPAEIGDIIDIPFDVLNQGMGEGSSNVIAHYEGSTENLLSVNTDIIGFPYGRQSFVIEDVEVSADKNKIIVEVNPSGNNPENETYKFNNTLIINLTQGEPDFYPTPKDSDQWQETYKVNAKTYTGKAGETIEIPVTVWNKGEEDITDLACTWWGGGWENPIQHWKDINLAKGESKEFTIPVTVPQPGQENRLVFRANIDGKTPASELNQDNNLMVVTVQPEGVDIQLMLPDNYLVTLKPGESRKVPVLLGITRNDPLETQTEPIDVDLTYTSPTGTATKKITVNPFPNDYYEENLDFTVTRAGTYTVSGEAYPVNVNDPDLSNNKDSVQIQVRVKKTAAKSDPDDETRVNLID